MGLDWLERAACKHFPPEWFFPARSGPDTTELAREVCAVCPVTAECLEFSMAGGRKQAEGIYAGRTAKERRALRRERNGMGKQKKTPSPRGADRPFEDFEAWRIRAMLPEPAVTDSGEGEEETTDVA